MKSFVFFVVFVVLCSCKPDALLICSYDDDARDTIFSTGLFNKVDRHLTKDGLPTMTELLQYPSVLVFGSPVQPFPNATELGNLLADYVDSGFGVLFCFFLNFFDSLKRSNCCDGMPLVSTDDGGRSCVGPLARLFTVCLEEHSQRQLGERHDGQGAKPSNFV